MVGIAVTPPLIITIAITIANAYQSTNAGSKYGLEKDFKINVECNHATLSGHSCEHELETARLNGVLGNIDANTGDAQTGWCAATPF